MLNLTGASLVLADTSIWVGHVRVGNTLLKDFLEEGVVLMHPCVRCELALGNMKSRTELLGFLTALPESEVATEEEVLHLIEANRLWGMGIGWVDAHLLAATKLTDRCALWTTDGSLRKACEKSAVRLFSGAV